MMSDPRDQVPGQLAGPEEPKKGLSPAALETNKQTASRPRAGQGEQVVSRPGGKPPYSPGWACDLASAPRTCTQNTTL